jgi:hypothetical protein
MTRTMYITQVEPDIHSSIPPTDLPHLIYHVINYHPLTPRYSSHSLTSHRTTEWSTSSRELYQPRTGRFDF